ncbi:DNA primase large subunit isoform X3 [Lethenteron reissneri]|nr:DNA primase large subunit isoform X3 [Lethenteron reissneri]XP_061425180.1 DNA primase large subunit isoform X3 [Lethenteron reissneri]XP_061425181.1 DNA primase large subunit isoform X3 [Lethenteron reissneri]XP_061425182.1 DNA primase large subunit isoform X3 [Lethenteron reissneri]
MLLSTAGKKLEANAVGSGDEEQRYPHVLQLYSRPPLGSVSLVEFEALAVQRLRLLKSVERIGVLFMRGTENYDKKLEEELKKSKFPYRDSITLTEVDDQEPRKRDHISHFILRLAYCQSEDLRRWFIQQEMDLFRFRFLQQMSESVTSFLNQNNLTYESLSKEEIKEYELKLTASTYGMSHHKVNESTFYKVPFTDALELVRSRKVFVRRGIAFIPQRDLVTIVLNDFRQNLSRALTITARLLPSVQEDERLQPLLTHLSKSYIGQDYSAPKHAGQISLDQLDSHAARSFPLCMRQVHSALREHHHLRHGGRMQYGLYLKGIGLTLQQSLDFWRAEFALGVGADKFDKSYAYNVRHNYGKEGKRTDYTPYSCMKIIMTNTPAQGDHHGCPFRHTEPELLKMKLLAYKVPSADISQILDLVKGMHYQLACQKYFEVTHKVEDTSFALNHPNEYFEESVRLLSGGRQAKKEADSLGRWDTLASSGSTQASQGGSSSNSQHLPQAPPPSSKQRPKADAPVKKELAELANELMEGLDSEDFLDDFM